ncbi:M64 family metallopeptidase [Bacteroides mediterraneensis]|uniref:M64 family metallopeptidase n=1 Tax=Bacteroides mediterraneensis TaxID=1841856 RepID=UPI001956DA48|nr:M64 family metallopeptidase [Bacteroides mediterraneensis]MBM6782075.1 peptidase M64 [Bacteroides mediterraneensis]
MKKTVWILTLGLSLCGHAFAQNFDDYFVDKTLLLDYIFTGNADKQDICLDELSSLPQWAGRHTHLSELPLAGNGEITMKDKATGKVIYRTSFSSLFQEWLGEKEAKVLTRGFENTFLVPYPKQPAEITVTLKDAYQKPSATLTHEVNPKDILIHQRGMSNLTPHRYLWKGGSSEKCIDVAIMAEGYSAKDEALFYKDAEIACESLFDHEPFKKLKDRFNIVAVFSESKDSGVSIPRNNEWKTTAVSSHFDTFYSDRYLTTRSVKAIHNWLAGIPYEHIIILANTDTYGGGGIYNSYTLTTAHHSMFRPVVVHEFGHSFGGLADEYAYDEAPSPLYPYSVEPWEPNITTLVHFEDKWKDMVKPGTPIPTKPQTDEKLLYTKVGVYEGGGYTKKGIYRPTTECRMKINEAPVFCPVCQRSLERLIRFYTE